MKKLPESAPLFCPWCGQKPSITGEALLRSVLPGTFLLGDMAISAVQGARVGMGMGIVAGPAGGMAGTIPGALVGALAGFAVNRSRGAIECKSCGTTFKILGIKRPAVG